MPYEVNTPVELTEIVQITKEEYDSLDVKDTSKVYVVVTDFINELKGE